MQASTVSRRSVLKQTGALLSGVVSEVVLKWVLGVVYLYEIVSWPEATP